MKLSLARAPGVVRQVVVESVTPTSLYFRLVPPEDDGGIRIDSFIAEYKETRKTWMDARKRYWFQGRKC